MPLSRAGQRIIGLALGAPLLVLIVCASAGAQSAGKIAFSTTRSDGEQADIFVMNPDGSGETRVTTDAAADVDPTWSGDGTRIAYTRIGFVRGGRSDFGDIYAVNADGTGAPSRLTKGLRKIDGHADWSSTGTQIAFQRERLSNVDQAEVMVMDADGTNERRLSNARGFDGYPSHSPDGTKIAFISDRFGNPEIMVMNADGSGQTRLTNHPAAELMPSWSPDGGRIAFISDRDGTPQLYVMPAGGGDARLATLGGDREHYPSGDYRAAWSPDSQRLAYTGSRDGHANDESFEIMLMTSGGGNATPLTEAAGSDFAPDWFAAPAAAARRSAAAGNLVVTPLRQAAALFGDEQQGSLGSSPAPGPWTGTPPGVVLLCGI